MLSPVRPKSVIDISPNQLLLIINYFDYCKSHGSTVQYGEHVKWEGRGISINPTFYFPWNVFMLTAHLSTSHSRTIDAIL